MEVSDELHAPVALPQGKSFHYTWIGGWVGPGALLNAVAKKKILSSPLPGIEPR
jgi:hypothetical protein